MNHTGVVREWTDWIVGLSLLALSLYVALGHAWVFWRRFVRNEGVPSWVPLLAGIIGALGLCALPIPGARLWWWLPFLLDYGSLPGLFYSVVYHYFRINPKLDDVRQISTLPASHLILSWLAVVIVPVVGYAILRSSAWLEAMGWIVGSVLFVTCAVLAVLISRPTK